MKRPRSFGPVALAPFLLPSLTVGACDPGPAPLTATETDSAGVRIIQHSALPDSGLGGWHLSERPVLSLGEVEGPEPFLFSSVRGIVRLTDGRIAVADGQTNEIRLFAPFGEHLFNTGGSGSGPGEFTTLGGLFRVTGDSLAATNVFERTLSVFGPDGQWVRSVRLEQPEGASAYWVEQVLENGSLLVQGSREFATGIPEEGYQRSQVTLSVYSGIGEPLSLLGSFAGSELQVEEWNGRLTARSLAMGREVKAVVSGEGIFVGETDRFEIRRYDYDGNLTAILRADVPPVPFTDDVRQRWIEQALLRLDDPERIRRARDQFDTYLWPDSLPVFSEFRGDGEGNLWVKRFRPSYLLGPDLWWVFEPNGHLLSSLEIPENLAVHAISGGFLAGLTRDELDVERVVVFRLER